MKINEVMKETGLTKKAIYYYENEGLIKPKKDPDNNYRIYTDEDIRTLVKINILRRLDLPIKAIGEILSNAVPMKEILKGQLVETNQRINLLYQNKMIMNDLITKDVAEKDFSFETLKVFNFKLDQTMTGACNLGKELERIFPGTLGKIFAIFYNYFLSVPLDGEDKINAWYELVSKLDEMKEIDYPDDIREIVDEMYGEQRQTNVPLVKEAADGYYANPANQKKIEGYYRLQNFILNHLDMFREIDKYIGKLNESRKTPIQ